MFRTRLISAFRTCRGLLPRVIVFEFVAVVGLAACATTPSGPAYRPAERPVREIPQSQADAIMAKVVAGYATAVGEPTPMHRAFITAIPSEAKGRVVYDPALDNVAQVLAAMVAERNQLPAKTLEHWLFWRFGVPFHPLGVRADIVRGTGADAFLKEKAAEHTGVLNDLPGRVAFGVARASAAGDRTAQVIVFASRAVDLGAEIPRSVEPGQSVTLSGRVLNEAEDMMLHYDTGSREGSGIAEVRVELNAQGAFSTSVTAPKTPGTYFIELTALQPGQGNASERWRRVLMSFPLHVGPAPTEPDEFITNPPANPASDEAIAAELLKLYQAARIDAGLPAFKVHKGLQKQAQGLADASAKSGQATSAPNLPAKMAARGFPSRRMGQVAGFFESASEQVWQDMLSPSMRSLLLDKRTQAIGLAIAPGERGFYHLSFVYAQPVGKLDPVKERAKLHDAFNKRRQHLGILPFADDKKLDAVVQAFAERVCAGEVAPDAFGELDAPLQTAAGGRYASVRTNWIVANVVLPSDVRRYKEIVKSQATTLAIGTCQGALPKRKGSEYVLLIEATRR